MIPIVRQIIDKLSVDVVLFIHMHMLTDPPKEFHEQLQLGTRSLCQHNFEHNGSLKALSIMPA